jgi:hypothetical protein
MYLELSERDELVHEMPSSAGFHMAVDAPVASVRSSRPSVVVRRHFVTRSAEPGAVRQDGHACGRNRDQNRRQDQYRRMSGEGLEARRTSHSVGRPAVPRGSGA